MKCCLNIILLVLFISLAIHGQAQEELAPPEIEGVSMTTAGSAVTFTVTATGGELVYQWLWQGHEIPDATNAVLQYVDAYASANAGFYTVRVSNPVNPDGVYSDPYALRFAKPAPNGTYQGLFYPRETVSTDASGFIQLQISGSKQNFSGKIVLGRSRYPFSGTFSPTHEADFEVSRADGPPLHVTLQLLTLNDTPEFVGFVSDGEWTSRVAGYRVYFSSKNRTTDAGKYTLSLLNTNAASSVPNGSGYATLSIKPNGNVVLRGKLADGEPFSQSGGLSRNGELSFYSAPYQGQGRVFGWLQVANEETSSISGPAVYWLRNEDPALDYPDGFSLVLTATGSTYAQPITAAVLNFTDGVTSFYAGDLFTEDTATWQFAKVILRPPATFRPFQKADKIDLKVNKKTGVLTGSFLSVTTGEWAPIRGVVLQKQNVAQGFFLSSGASGAFSLVPGTPVP